MCCISGMLLPSLRRFIQVLGGHLPELEVFVMEAELLRVRDKPSCADSSGRGWHGEVLGATAG